MYDPKVGRFLSEDPIGLSDGVNVYAYVHNDPMNATDPTGLQTNYLSGIGSALGSAASAWAGATLPGYGTFSMLPSVAASLPQIIQSVSSYNDPNAIAIGRQVGNRQNEIARLQGEIDDRDSFGNRFGGFLHALAFDNSWESRWVAGHRQTQAQLRQEIAGLTEQFNAAGYDKASFGLYAGDDHYFYGGKGLAGAVDASYGVGRMDGLQSVFVDDFMLATGAGAVGRTALPALGSAAQTKTGIALARELGAAGEAAVGLNGSKVGIRIPGSNRLRFPDALNHASKTLSEVKNVGKLSYTQQLRDFAAYASHNGMQFNLFVRPSTKLSGPLQTAVEVGEIILNVIPGVR